eukprot:11578648-Alexandrium_andersonii.AAC.1
MDGPGFEGRLWSSHLQTSAKHKQAQHLPAPTLVSLLHLSHQMRFQAILPPPGLFDQATGWTHTGPGKGCRRQSATAGGALAG